jgi:hypothetical protein
MPTPTRPRPLPGFALLLIILGCLLAAGSLGYYTFATRPQAPGAVPLPVQIGSLPLRVTLEGQEALENLTRLHSQEFDLVSGSVGFYGPHREAILWVSGAASDHQAAQMVEDMRLKIDQGRSPFQPIHEIHEGSRTIYVLTGMGQVHYYYQSAGLVVWLAAPPEQAETLLADCLAFYP